MSTREKVIKLAQEAGLHIATDVNWMPIIGLEYAERFVKAVLANTDPKSSMSYQEGYEAGLDAGRAEQQADMESMYAMYKQACRQRDELMDQQRAMVAAMRGQLQ